MKNFWNACKELLEKKKKKLIQSSLPEVFVKNTMSEFLFQSVCNFVKKGTPEEMNFTNSPDYCF